MVLPSSAFCACLFCLSSLVSAAAGNPTAESNVTELTVPRTLELWNYASILALIVMLTVSYKKHRSVSTLIEITLVVLLKWWFKQTSFIGYFFSKYLQSAIFFAYHCLFTDKYYQLPQLTYCISYPSDPFHAALQYKTNVWHYAFPRDKSVAVDRSYALSPVAIPIGKGSDARLNQPCGFAYVDFDDSNINKLLASCGRCHNWAIISCYEMSADKFFSLSMLSFLRWDMWIVSGLSLLFAPLSLTVAGAMADLLLIVLLTVDTMNMDKLQLRKNQELASPQLDQFKKNQDVGKQLAKFGLLLVIWIGGLTYPTVLIPNTFCLFWTMILVITIVSVTFVPFLCQKAKKKN
jgi:hypothetical protein